jgi:xylan 1,4-beta-xylosidase
MIKLDCSLTGQKIRLPHVWEHTVGCGHAPLLLRADLQSHLRQCRRELGFEHVRFHGLLSAPMDAVICQNEKWLYSFFNADQIIDFLLSIGMRPFVELSFMPAALASGTKTVFHYRANVTPPKDPAEWGTLITRLVQHWMDRYGRDEVTRWLFEE